MPQQYGAGRQGRAKKRGEAPAMKTRGSALVVLVLEVDLFRPALRVPLRFELALAPGRRGLAGTRRAARAFRARIDRGIGVAVLDAAAGAEHRGGGQNGEADEYTHARL